jgi:hypothetical protein
MSGGEKSVSKFLKKFREVDMRFVITFWVQFLLMASLPGAQNTKYATGAGGFKHFNMWKFRKT